jgi:hypothetical protein
MNTTTYFVKGDAWISNKDSDGYWAEGESCQVFVERIDDNEIRLGVQLRDSDSDDATVYLTDAEATRLAQMLGSVVLDS